VAGACVEVGIWMKGIIGANIIHARVGTFVIRIECRDEESAKRLIRKLRLIGIYVSTDKI